MRKRELLHLHALLYQIADHYDIPLETTTNSALAGYMNHGVSPSHIHRSKTAHQTAVEYLVHGLANHFATTTQAEAASDPASAHTD